MIGPSDLIATIRQAGPGEYEEHRFSIEIHNKGESEIAGNLLPALTEWYGRKDISNEHFAIDHNGVHFGGEGVFFAWTPKEFIRDVFVTVPSSCSSLYLTASLIYESGGRFENYPDNRLHLGPQERAIFTLHVDAGSGGRAEGLREIFRVRGGYRVAPKTYRFDQYENPSLDWIRNQVVTWLNWAWDRDVMDPVTGVYNIVDSLRKARRKFWGYDVYMIWPFWPRAGFDDRFQFDHFREMPGGLEGLKMQVKEGRKLGTRFVVSYFIWCESDRDASKEALKRSFSDLVDLALDIEADGVLMDTMSATPEEIKEMARERGRELACYNEWDPGWEESQTNLTGRIHNSFPMPRFNLKRYLLPHHPILRVCEPGNEGRVMRNDFVMSFFHGHGVEINTMLPQKSPQCDEDWQILARAVDILRTNRACFSSKVWEPFVPSESPDVWINLWPYGNKRLYTLCGINPDGYRGTVLKLPHNPETHTVDLWRCRPIEVKKVDGIAAVSYEVEGYAPSRGVVHGSGDYSTGCIAVLPRLLDVKIELEMLNISLKGAAKGQKVELWMGTVRPDRDPVVLEARAKLEVDLYKAFGVHTNEAIVVRLLDEGNQLLDVAVAPESLVRLFRIDKPAPTGREQAGSQPEGMVRITGGSFQYIIEHTQPVWQPTYTNIDKAYETAPKYSREVELGSFWMDRYPVTNRIYQKFLKLTGYEPEEPANFLKHWAGRKCPANLENHPVVYVTYEDAKVYASWAGQRLPTEEEWQYAAGGARGYRWPWGKAEPTGEFCSLDAGGTQPVNTHARGASPFGVEDLVGNVWQWTSSLMDNGRHLVVFLRGGSWYRSPKGIWWIRGGPRPIADHMPLPLFGPAMNRFSTIGFRCVKDS
jgi:formylglycine-generating enzyme required for sulfatase activity